MAIKFDPMKASRDDFAKLIADYEQTQGVDVDPNPSNPAAGGIGQAFVEGAKQTGRALGSAFDVYTGDKEEIQQDAQIQSDKTGAQRRFLSALEENKEEGGDDTIWQGIKNVASAVYQEPMGALHETAGQVPNSAVVLGGMVAGAKAGAALAPATGGASIGIGAIVGGIFGRFAGNTAIETGFIAQEAAQEGENLDLGKIREQGAIKGGVITVIDSLTLGANRLMAGAPGKAAGKAATEALDKLGVDTASNKAIANAISNPAVARIALEAGHNAALKAMPSSLRKVAEKVGGFGLETASEAAGEYLGSTAAGLDASFTEAVLEGMLSVPQSAVELGVSSVVGGRDNERFLQRDDKGNVMPEFPDQPIEAIEGAPRPLTPLEQLEQDFQAQRDELNAEGIGVEEVEDIEVEGGARGDVTIRDIANQIRGKTAVMKKQREEREAAKKEQERVEKYGILGTKGEQKPVEAQETPADEPQGEQASTGEPQDEVDQILTEARDRREKRRDIQTRREQAEREYQEAYQAGQTEEELVAATKAFEETERQLDEEERETRGTSLTELRKKLTKAEPVEDEIRPISGKPFRSEEAANNALKIRKLQGQYEPTEKDGGWVLTPVQQVEGTDATEEPATPETETEAAEEPIRYATVPDDDNDFTDAGITEEEADSLFVEGDDKEYASARDVIGKARKRVRVLNKLADHADPEQARSEADEEVDKALLRDIDEVEKTAAQYEADGMSPRAAFRKAIQEKLDNVGTDYTSLVERVKALKQEEKTDDGENVPTEDEPQPGPSGQVPGGSGEDLPGVDGPDGGRTGGDGERSGSGGTEGGPEAGGGGGDQLPTGQPEGTPDGDRDGRQPPQQSGDGGGGAPVGGSQQDGGPPSPEPGPGGVGGDTGEGGNAVDWGDLESELEGELEGQPAAGTPTETPPDETGWDDLEKELEGELEPEPTPAPAPAPTGEKPPATTGGAPAPSGGAPAPTIEPEPTQKKDPGKELIDLFQPTTFGAPEATPGAEPQKPKITLEPGQDPRTHPKWGQVAGLMDNIATMKPRPENLGSVAGDIIAYLKGMDGMTPEKAKGIFPFIKAWAADVRDGKRDPWATVEAPVEQPQEMPAEPEPEEKDASIERVALVKKIKKRVAKMGADIPAALKQAWTERMDKFETSISTIEDKYERLDWQNRLARSKRNDNTHPETMGYRAADGSWKTIESKTPIDGLRQLAETSDEDLMPAVIEYGNQMRYVNTEIRRRDVPEKYRRKSYQVFDPKLGYTRSIEPPRGTKGRWRTLTDYIQRRLVANNEKKKTPTNNLMILQSRLEKMASRVRGKDGQFVDSELGSYEWDIMHALNRDYDEFLKQLDNIAKKAKKHKLSRTDIQERRKELQEARAKKKYDGLVQQARDMLNEIPAEHEKKDGFAKRFDRIISDFNNDGLAVRVVDLETLIFQMERRDDVYVEPEPVTDYESESAIEERGGVRLGAKMPTGQYPGWRSWMKSFGKAIRQVLNMDIDEYVASKLGYDSAQEIADMGYLAAEQIDAVAKIIRTIDTEGAFILADQTGVGKGRQLAAGIAYAVKQGLPVVFMTEKATLFADIIRDMEDIGMRMKDDNEKPIPGRYVSYGIVNSGSLDPDAQIDGQPLAGIRPDPDSTAELLEETAKDWANWGKDVLFVTYTQFHAKDPTKDKKAKTASVKDLADDDIDENISDEESDTAIRRMNAIREIATNAVLILDESHEAAGENKDAAMATRARRKGMSLEQVPQSRGGFLRTLVQRSRSTVFSSATFAKRPENLDIYAMRTNMWRSLVGVRDMHGLNIQLSEVFRRGGVAMQQIFSAMLSRDGGMARRQRSLSDAVFEDLEVDVPIESVDKLSKTFAAIAKFDRTYTRPFFEKMQAQLQLEAGTQKKVQLYYGEFVPSMHNWSDMAYAALTVQENVARAIAEAEAGNRTIVTFAQTGESMLKTFLETTGHKVGDTFDFSMADVAKAYLLRLTRYQVKIKSRNRLVNDPEYKYLDLGALGPQAMEDWKKIQEAMEKDLGDMIGSPFDYAKSQLEAAGLRIGEITGRDYYLEPKGDNQWTLRRRKAKGTAHNRATVKKFNGGTLDDPVAEDDQIDVVIMNKSGAVGTSMHASAKFTNQNKRVMLVAQGEKDINLYMQILGRIDRTGQILEREVDGQMVANNPTFIIPRTTIPGEVRMRAMLDKKLESLNANLSASGKGTKVGEDESTITNEQLISPIGTWAVSETLRDNPNWMRDMEIAEDELAEEGVDAMLLTEALARKATKNAALLDSKNQKSFYQDVEERFKAEAQRRIMLGENIGAMAVHDIRAVGRKSLILDDPVGKTVFEGPIQAIEVVAEYTNAAPDLDFVLKDTHKRLTAAGFTAQDSETEKPLTSLKQKGVKLARDLLSAADVAAEERKKEIREDPSLSDDQKESRINKIDSAYEKLVNGTGTKGTTGMFRMLVPGQAIQLYLDGEWRMAIVTNMMRSNSVNPYSLASWKVDIVAADPHQPSLRSYSLSNFSEYDPIQGVDDQTIPIQPYEFGMWGAERDFFEGFAENKRRVEEGVESRVVITGNIIRAFAKYGERRGVLTQVTDPTGRVGVAYLLSPQYPTLESIRPFAIQPENGDEYYQFLNVGKHDPDMNPLVEFMNKVTKGNEISVTRVHLAKKDRDGNDIEYGRDVVFTIPKTGLKTFSLISKFGTKAFLAKVNGVQEGDLEGSSVIGGGKKQIKNVPYHFIDEGDRWTLRIPLRKDQRNAIAGGLQLWRNAVNPETITLKINGSEERAQEALRQVKKSAGRSEQAWPSDKSILGENEDEDNVRYPYDGGPMGVLMREPNHDPNFTYKQDLETQENIKTAAEMWVEYLESKTGASFLASQMTKDFIDHGSTLLFGLKAETAEDIAILGQTMRNPSFEKLTAFIVKDGAVVDYFSVSNRLPGSVSLHGQEAINDAIKRAMAATNADGFYITHNHPSGDPDPSGGVGLFGNITNDRGATMWLANNVEGFLGHIVLNETEYGVVPPQDITSMEFERAITGEDVSWGYKRPLPKVALENPRRWSLTNRLRDDPKVADLLAVRPEGGRLFTPQQIEKFVAAAGKNLSDPDKTFVLIGTGGAKKVNGVITVPLAVLDQANTERGKLKLAAWMRKFYYLTGSNEVFAYGIPDRYSSIVQEALNNGLLDMAIKDDLLGTAMLPTKEEAAKGKKELDVFYIEPGDRWTKIAKSDDPITSPEQEAEKEDQPETQEPRIAERVREQARKFMGRGNSMMKSGRLKVVANDADLPGHLQVEEGGVQGVVDPVDNTVYIVANNAKDNVKGVLLHEVGVHAGLKNLLGDKFDDVMRQLRGLKIVKKPAVLEAYSRIPDDTPSEHIDEEALGYLVENAKDMSILDKIIAGVRQWLYRNGWAVETLSEKDMMAMVAAAARSYGNRAEAAPMVNGEVQKPKYSRVADAVQSALGPRQFTRNDRVRGTDETWTEKAKRMVRRQLFPGGLLPDEVFKLKIGRDSMFEVEELEITSLVAHYEDAVKKAYGKRADKLDEATQRLLKAELESPRPTGNVPEPLATAIHAMRREITRLSDKYALILEDEINELLADKKDNAAQARANLLKTILRNRGKYVHRSYKAFDDPKWPSKVPDEVMDNAIAYLEARNEEEALKYDEWADKAEAKNDNEKAARHRERAAILRHPAHAEQQARKILAEGTAYDNMSSFIKESKLGAKDLTVLMKKNNEIAPEILALLGEHIDPRVNFAKSATKMSRLIYNQEFLNNLLEIGLGNFIWEKDDVNRPIKSVPIAPATAERYKPLAGYYVEEDVNQAFIDALGQEQMENWYRTIVRMNGLVKYGKTVLSPTTAARNWMSALFFAMANGHFDLRNMKHSVKSLREYFTHKGDSLAYLKHLKELGVVYDTPYAGEMMRLLQDSELDRTLASGHKLEAKRLLDYATRFYQFGDDYWKIAGFESEKQLLMKHKGMSLEEAELAAAERIRNTYPTYSMVGRFINQLRRFPLAGTFVSFPAEIIRTSSNILRYAAKDMADPDLRPLAMRRLAGIAIASSSMAALQSVFMALNDVDDDEEEAFRDLAAPWQRNSNIMPLWRDENGNLNFLDLSFLDPYNYWKRPLNAIMRDQPWEDKAKDVLLESFTPFFGTDIVAGALIEVFTNQRETGGRVYNPSDDPVSQLKDITNHLRRTVQPGIANNVERTISALQGKISPSGRRYSLGAEAAAFMGFRVSVHDPRAALYYKSFEFRDAKKNATSIMTAVARDPNTVSDDDLRSAFERSMMVRTQAYVEMARLVSAARASGMSEPLLRSVLRQSGISKQDVRALALGEVPMYRPSKGYLKQAVNKARVLFPDRAAEIEGRRKLVREMTYDTN